VKLAGIVEGGIYSNGINGYLYSEYKVLNIIPSEWDNWMMNVEYEVVNGHVAENLKDRRGIVCLELFAKGMESRIDIIQEQVPSSMTRALLYAPVEQEIIHSGCSIDERRQAIGYIYVKYVEAFRDQLVEAFRNLHIQADYYFEYHGDNHKSLRIELCDCPLVQELNSLSKRPIEDVGFYFKFPTTNVKVIGRQTIREKDESRYVVWIYGTIHQKALTHLRKFLHKHIIEYNVDNSI
jgi:hypothetical protein